MYQGVASIWTSVETGSNAADAILPVLKETKQQLEEHGILTDADPACLSIRCAAHSFQFLLEDVDENVFDESGNQGC